MTNFDSLVQKSLKENGSLFLMIWWPRTKKPRFFWSNIKNFLEYQWNTVHSKQSVFLKKGGYYSCVIMSAGTVSNSVYNIPEDTCNFFGLDKLFYNFQTTLRFLKKLISILGIPTQYFLENSVLKTPKHSIFLNLPLWPYSSTTG